MYLLTPPTSHPLNPQPHLTSMMEAPSHPTSRHPGKKGVTLARAEFDQLRLVMEQVDRLVEPPEGDLLA